MGRVEQYRAELRRLTEWEPFLKKSSGRPGAKGPVKKAAMPAKRARKP